MQGSAAEAYAQRKGWNYEVNGDQMKIEVCPVCKKDKFHFFMHRGGNKDGLWQCHYCGKSGNLTKLQTQLGDKIEGVVSQREWANANQTPDPLPDIQKCQYALLNDDDALDYLYTTRGFTPEVVQKQKLGLEEFGGKKWLVIPYFDRHNQYTFAKYRTVPPADKDFRSPRHREAGLYNEGVIRKEMDELVIVEGEADALSCMSNGIENVVGVPGANTQKADWIGLLDAMKPQKIYIMYDTDTVGQKAAQQLAQRIGVDRCLKLVLPEFTKLDGQKGKDINEWFLAGHSREEFEELKQSAVQFDVEGVMSAGTAFDEMEQEILEKGELKPTYVSPWPELNEIMGGAEPGDVIAIIAEGKVGKEQPLSSRILTPSGWSTMGQMTLGARLASIDGQPSVVTGVFPQGYKPVYRLLFSDGRSTRAGASHLWMVGSVSNFSRDGYRIVTTLQLRDLLQGKDEWFIPLFNGEWGFDSDLPLDPWLLGTLLGDGGFSSGNCSFTKDDPELVQEVNYRLRAYGCELKREDDINYSIVGVNRGINRIRDILRDLGLFGRTSVDKFIPRKYLSAKREDRLALLRGLMDTDGSVEGTYNVPCFNTSSSLLAQDVVELVRSLGGIAEAVGRIPTFIYNGEKKQGERAFRIYPKLNHEPAFLHSRKAKLERERKRSARLKVVSVELSGQEQCQCITVSHPSKLYITDDFITTHNTTLADQWADEFTVMYGQAAMMLNKEMPPKRLARKLLARLTQTDDTPGKSQITVQTVQQGKALLRERKADYYYAYSKGADFKKDADTIRQAVRRYGIKMVVIDNLQAYARSITHQTQEIFVLSKQIKELAMELAPLGVFIVLIVQPNRVRDGEIVAARNAAGSSGIEKDVDCMIAAHRKRIGRIRDDEFQGFMETDANFEPQMMLRVDLSRYAAGGIRTVYFDGAKSTVRSLGVEQKQVQPVVGDYVLQQPVSEERPEV